MMAVVVYCRSLYSPRVAMIEHMQDLSPAQIGVDPHLTIDEAKPIQQLLKINEAFTPLSKLCALQDVSNMIASCVHWTSGDEKVILFVTWNLNLKGTTKSL